MRDCENVDIRERLPELLNEQLHGAEREDVLAHLRDCADCSAELALMRSARAVIVADAARIDIAAIARGVQRGAAGTRASGLATPVARKTGRSAARSRWGAGSPTLRAAAAVVLVALGAGGVLVARTGEAPRSAGVQSQGAESPVVDTFVAAGGTVATAAESASGPAASGSRARAEAPPTSALGATFADLSDDELAAVLRAIDETDGTLPAEPAPVPSVVAPDEDGR